MSENVQCLQVPVRHVRSGQHATVALHPSHLPLQPSQATQQFMQAPQISFTPLTLNANGSTTEDPSTADQQASLQGVVHQQQEQHWQQQQQQLASQLQGASACSEGAAASAAAGSASSATSTAASGSVNGEQKTGAAAEQTLPAGLMSQALNRQSQMAEQQPWQQQQDPYVLDHRIHHRAEEEHDGQQQLAAATAVARHACSLASDASVPVPSMTKSAIMQSDCTHVPMSESQSVAGAVSSSPTGAGPATPNARKGMVLLDAAMHTRTAWQFQAVIVLLNGHWPPRGLLSGRWPPKSNTPDTVLSTSLPDSPLGASACTCACL